MRSGYPDYHQFPERDHGDESFWPSFTDIMMLITMVFLLVTVMAITNNFKLVADLKESIQAERLAAEQALDKEAQNNSLEDQMVMLQKRLVDASKVAVDKQVANEALQEELTRILTKVTKIEQELEASLKAVQEREKQLALTSEQVDALKADRDKQLATLSMRAQALTNLQGIQETSQQQVLRLQAALDQKQAELLTSQQDNKTILSELSAAEENVLEQQAALKAEQLALQEQKAALEASKAEELELRGQRASLQASTANSASKIAALEIALERANGALATIKRDGDTQLADLQEQLRQTEATLDSSRESQQLSEKELAELRDNQQLSEKELADMRENQQLTEKQLIDMRAEVIALEQAKQDEAAALEALREEMAQLTDLRAQDEARLETLKTEFDSLDTKYQKLMRPARSSEGKHVVSVWFSKQGGREVYKIRDSAQGGFATTTRRGMTNTLASLKNRYGKELYVKVIIPENSGLSYSDAWRFTTEMQRAYDYYYQDNE